MCIRDSYTGPWNPSPGQHSSYNHARRGISFWKNNVGINPSKLTLGVPFYGYDFQNSTTVESFTYGSIVDSDISNSEKDNVGINTIMVGQQLLKKLNWHLKI